MTRRLSLTTLKEAVSIKERIIELETRLNVLFGGRGEGSSEANNGINTDKRRGRKRSAAIRRKMAAAQKARWAKKKSGTS